MSNAINDNVKIVESIDEVVNVSNTRVYGVENSGSYSTYSTFDSTTQNTKSGPVSIICNPPDESTFVDPNIYIKAVFQGSYAGALNGSVGITTLLAYGYDAPRAFGWSSICNSIVAKVNGFTLSTNLGDYITALEQFHDDKPYDYEETTPTMRDQYQSYEQGVLGNRNPLGLYADNSFIQTRGSFSNFNLTSNATTATVDLTLYEKLYLSPFAYSKIGLAGIKTLTLAFTFNDINRVMSLCPNSSGALARTFSNIGSAMTLLTTSACMKFITPKIQTKIPKSLSWKYNEMFVLSNDSTALAFGASATIQINATNLEAVPGSIIIYARCRDSDLSPFRSDSFALINTVNVQWGNKTGIFNSATQQDLYNMSVKYGGLKRSYSQWSDFVGSVFVIPIAEVVTDLQAPGVLDNPQFSIKVNFTNNTPANTTWTTTTFTLYAIVVYEGIFSIKNGQATSQISVLTKEDVLKSSERGMMKVPQLSPENMLGGGKLGFVKDLLKAGIDVGDLILGGKRKKKKSKKVMKDGKTKVKKSKKKGGALLGGSLLKTKDLKKMLIEDIDEELENEESDSGSEYETNSD